MERALWLILAMVGGIVAVLIGAVVFLGGEPEPVRPTNKFPPVEHDLDAADALQHAWERWRRATFVAIGSWERTVDGVEEPLVGDVSIAQDPPRRLVIRLGNITEQTDTSIATCTGSNNDIIAPACVPGEVGTTYDERLTAELAAVATYVEGFTRLYDVEASDPGCFRVGQRVSFAAAPWGRWAEFCFDPATGAMSSTRVRRAGATDVETAVLIRAEVSDADFGG